MNIRQISVNAARVIAHPKEPRGQLKFSVCYTAELAEGDCYEASTLALQAMAELANDRHQTRLLADIEDRETPVVPIKAVTALPRDIWSNSHEGQAVS